MRLQLLSDRFGDFALDREGISQIASIRLGPKVRIAASVDQLRVHSHLICNPLDTAFQHVSNAQRLTNLSQVTRGRGLVLVYAGAADHFQVGDLGQIGEDFILNAVGEIGVGFVFAQVFKNGSTAMLLSETGSAAPPGCPEPVERQDFRIAGAKMIAATLMPIRRIAAVIMTWKLVSRLPEGGDGFCVARRVGGAALPASSV
jgi:hypothetical protein